MRRTLFYNRYTKTTEEEKVVGRGWLRFAYTTVIGKLGVALLIKRKIFSIILGKLASSSFSKKKIVPFIEKYGIKKDSFEKKIDEFTSFNDFFSRKLKPTSRPISPKANTISAPSDGRYLAFENISNLSPFFIKGEQFTVDELIADENKAAKFASGSMLISRLCVTDYHRFHFPIACVPDKTFLINGDYLSVHPIAMKGDVSIFLQNKRMSTILHSKACGDILMIEIGSTGVGTIQQTFTPEKEVLKGDEKGYFEFGGSTVILIFENGRVRFSEDLLENTSNGLETYVLMGDEVASII